MLEKTIDSLVDLMPIAWIASIAFGFLAVRQTLSRGLIRKMDAHEIIWSRPWAWSPTFGLFAVPFFLAPLMFGEVPHPRSEMPAVIMMDMMGIGLGIFLIRFGVTQNFRFDLDQRTYRYTERFLFYSWTVTGDFNDIAGVYVVSGWSYKVAWKPRRNTTRYVMMKTALEVGTYKTIAEIKAERMAAALGVSVIRGPNQWW